MMSHEVALAMLKQNEHWLLQLRDNSDNIIFPGHWGLFGGHLDKGETPQQAVHRELMEELGWRPLIPLKYWFTDVNDSNIAHIFLGELGVPIGTLELKEGEDLKLTNLKEILTGMVWSEKIGEQRPIAPRLHIVIERLMNEINEK
tara:strand:+ start:126 stop:560 length:435 start_codon:yes stop_codon:yes gene_type:complete